MSHPSITFRQEFLDLHPDAWLQEPILDLFSEDFLGRIQRLKVDLATRPDGVEFKSAQVNDNTQKTQWAAWRIQLPRASLS